ncbi:MAG: nascent polypeptide-associated complex protein [Candidatus Micrarchaeia archaeon]
MIPNLDSRTLKNLMSQMGIKTTEISASKVIIETADKDIVITNPQVTQINAQGIVSFQISGEISENEKSSQVEITEEDINIVAEKTGIADRERIKKVLEQAKGDIAEAILQLQEEQ